MSVSLMDCQMMRVISSPSSSTTVPSTLIFSTKSSSCSSAASVRVSVGARRVRLVAGGSVGQPTRRALSLDIETSAGPGRIRAPTPRPDAASDPARRTWPDGGPPDTLCP